MKLNHPEPSTPQQTSESDRMYKYFESITSDWTEAQELFDDWQKIQMAKEEGEEAIRTGAAVFYEGAGWAFAPIPPTPEAVQRAKFVDKTYVWRKK